MIATLFARLLGFLREILVAYKFGTSVLSDSFIVSFSIPELMISGFGAAIGTLYIPLFYKLKDKNEDREIHTFNFNISVLLLSIAGIVVVLFKLFPNLFIKIFASGFDNETLDLTVHMTKVIIYSTFPIMLAYLYKAYAQIKKKFALATLLGCSTNISVIIAILFVKKDSVMWLAYATLTGNIIYAILLYFIVKKDGYKSKATLQIVDDNIKEVGKGFLPVALSNLIYEINQIIDRNFASNLAVGTISALNYSSKIINMVTAVFGTSIASIIYPRITKLHSSGDEKAEAEELMTINIGMLIILLPVAFIFCSCSRIIISILFGRGNFDENSIKITSECLMFYAIGVIGFNLKSIWVRTFNARLDTKTPAFNSFISVVLNLIMNLLFINILHHKGLALATVFSSIITDVLLIRKYALINVHFKIRYFLKELIKSIVALIGYIPVIIFNVLTDKISIVNICILIITMIISTIIYITLLYIFKCEFIVNARRTFFRKFSK